MFKQIARIAGGIALCAVALQTPPSFAFGLLGTIAHAIKETAHAAKPVVRRTFEEGLNEVAGNAERLEARLSSLTHNHGSVDVMLSSARYGNANAQLDDMRFLDPGDGGHGIHSVVLSRDGDDLHEIYVVAPDDAASYTKVFSGNYSRAYENEIAATERVLRNTASKPVFAKAGDGVAKFRKSLRHMSGRVVSVIGHNESGMFKFLNGESVHLRDLARICHQAGKVCVFFSCDAQSAFRKFRVDFEIGANTSLNYLEAANAAARLDAYLKTRKQISTARLVKELPALVDTAVSTSQMHARLTVIATGSAATASVAAAIVTLDSVRPASAT
jgi:hypothetical protein